MMRDSRRAPIRISAILGFLICFACTVAVSSLHAQYLTHEIEVAEGVVRSLNFESSVAVIDGLSYYVKADAVIEIRGTYGAFTMLEKGMKVSFSYYRINDYRREIIKLIQLSDNRRIDEH